MNELYIVVEKDALESYKSLKDSLTSFDNLSEFVVKERHVFCLTYKGKKKGKTDWEIGEVPLKDIAKAFLESVE